MKFLLVLTLVAACWGGSLPGEQNQLSLAPGKATKEDDTDRLPVDGDLDDAPCATKEAGEDGLPVFIKIQKSIYVLESKLGEGSFGNVYLAEKLNADGDTVALVAVKVPKICRNPEDADAEEADKIKKNAESAEEGENMKKLCRLEASKHSSKRNAKDASKRDSAAEPEHLIVPFRNEGVITGESDTRLGSAARFVFWGPALIP